MAEDKRSMLVQLSWDEMQRAADIGTRRRIGALSRKIAPRYGANNGWEKPWAMDFLGAAGELVAARALGLHWTASLDPQRSESDLVGPYGTEVEVRSAAMAHFNLIINPLDNDNTPFVLVTGVGPVFRIEGWIFAAEGKKPELWGCTTNISRPCYLVPKDGLRSVHELQSMLSGTNPWLPPWRSVEEALGQETEKEQEAK